MSDILLPGDAGFADVLAGKKFTSKNGYNVAGTMPNNGAVTITPSASSQAIPAGYHNGGGNVPAVTVPAANVLTGTTIAGTVGSMPDRGAVVITPSAANQSIPSGFHNGSGNVSAVVVPAANVLTGTTIAGTAGTMPENGSPIWTPNTADQALTAGHFTGGTVKGDANLLAANILSGIPIFGVAGTAPIRHMARANSVATSSGMLSFLDTNGTGQSIHYVTVGGLTFTPTFIVAFNFDAVDASPYLTVYSAYETYDVNCPIIHQFKGNIYKSQLVGNAYVNSSGFQLPSVGSGYVEWYAWA